MRESSSPSHSVGGRWGAVVPPPGAGSVAGAAKGGEERPLLSPAARRKAVAGPWHHLFLFTVFLCSLYLEAMRGVTAPAGPPLPGEVEGAEIPGLSAFLRRGARAKGFQP